MLSYFEERRRIGFPPCTYKVRTWRFLGIRIYRRWEQLTVNAIVALPSER